MDILALNDLRQKVLRGEPVTKDELREAISTLRGARLSANAAAAEKASAPKTSSRGSALAGIDVSAILANALKK